MKNIPKSDFISSRVRYIPLERIVPNPHQPRRDFDPEGLSELADSIRQYGVLQPATVRTRGRDYELVAGERRLRAAKMAGLRELPCLIAQVGEEDSALLALMENLQRRDLSFMEEAAAIAQLVQRWGLSQEEAASAALAQGRGGADPAGGSLRASRPGPAAADGPGGAAGGGENHPGPAPECGSNGGIHRDPAAGNTNGTAPTAAHLHIKGCPSVSQQPGPLLESHALGGGKCRLRPPGHGG